MIVLISGRAGSGKSTLKDALIVELANRGIIAASLRFAQPVYEAHWAAQRALGMYGIEYKEKDRVLLQLLGTEWGRMSRGEDVWVNALKYRANQLVHGIHSLSDRVDVVIVDDARFPNEKDTDFGLPKLTVRLECDAEMRRIRLGDTLPPEHASETSLDDAMFDLYYRSDRSVASALAENLATEIQRRLDGKP